MVIDLPDTLPILPYCPSLRAQTANRGGGEGVSYTKTQTPPPPPPPPSHLVSPTTNHLFDSGRRYFLLVLSLSTTTFSVHMSSFLICPVPVLLRLKRKSPIKNS